MRFSPWRDSVSILRRGFERAPDSVHALTNLGLELVERERFDEGSPCWRAPPSQCPLYSNVHVSSGYAYAKAGRLAEARAATRRPCRCGPTTPSWPWSWAACSRNWASTTDAETRFREALRRDPELANAWLFLGTLLQHQGRVAEAEPFL